MLLLRLRQALSDVEHSSGLGGNPQEFLLVSEAPAPELESKSISRVSSISREEKTAWCQATVESTLLAQTFGRDTENPTFSVLRLRLNL